MLTRERGNAKEAETRKSSPRLIKIPRFRVTRMTDLTERQIQILKTIIEEYIETAEPVGSETIEKKYPQLGISPATIRNEMLKLTKMGYLRQPHTSAGRLPTPTGLKFYIKELMKTKELSVAEEVAVKEKIWDYRYEFEKLLREATRALAEKTRTLSLATTEEGDIYYSGVAQILEMPEFYDIDLTKTVLSLLDRFDYLSNLFSRATGEEDIHILLGEELEGEYLEPCGFVFTHYQGGSKHSGVIGIIGPVRLNYPSVIPIVRYFGNLIAEIGRNW